MPGKIEINIIGTEIKLDLHMDDAASEGEIMVGQLLAREVESAMNAASFQLLAMMVSSPTIMSTRDGMMPVSRAVATMLAMGDKE